MDFKLPLTEIKTPEDVQKLVSALSELAESLDVLYTETAPNGTISDRIGRIAIYKNGSTYQQWQNVDGGTTWQQIGATPDLSGYGDMFYANTRIATGSFTKNLTEASGTQQVTVGFQPKAVIFFGSIDNAAKGLSIGIDNTNNTVKAQVGGSVWGQYTSNISIYVAGAVDGDQFAKITATDSTSFTLSWTKEGSPTGTAVIHWMAFR